MLTPQEQEIMLWLQGHNSAFEVYKKTNFQFYRRSKDGRDQKVSVEILDRGALADQDLRYHCTAKSDDGRVATGNPSGSIEVLLATVHWQDLDLDKE